MYEIAAIPFGAYAIFYLGSRSCRDNSGLNVRQLAQYKIKIKNSSGLEKAKYILSGKSGALTDEIIHRKLTEKGFKEEYKSEIESLMKL